MNVFGNRYQVERPLGAGGAGEVWLVGDRLEDGRRLALKRLRPEHVARRGTAAIIREFRLMSRLQHPNLVEVHDLALAPDCFFTMEYVDGRRLHEAALDEDELVEVAVQVCRALEHVHRHGVVHQDVTPGNVLVRREGALVAKLTDFGIATDARSVHGYTAGFVAPEVIEGRPFDARADLYALGRTLLAVVTSQVADTSTLQLTTQEPGARRGAFVADLDALPERLAPIVARLLRPDPAERYGSAAQVLEALGVATGRVFPLDTAASRTRRLADPLVGREPELQRLSRAWERAREGRGGSVLVLGASGLGKSQLTRRLVVQAQLDGALVAHARAGTRAWSPVVAIATQLGGRPLEQLATADEIATDASRSRLAVELVAEIRAATRQRPVVVVVEDLHRVDEGSLQVLRALTELPKLLLVTTSRTAVEGLDDEVIALLPLDRARTEGLLASAGTLPPDLVADLAERSGGNLLFLQEALRLVEDRPDHPVPVDLQGLAAARLATLHAGEARLLRLAALLGPRFEWEALATVGGPNVRADLVELVNRHLLAADGTGYRFAYEALHTEAQRQARSSPGAPSAHRSLARATEARGDPLLTARLWLDSSEPERALPWFVDAADRAARAFDHAGAVAALDEALRLPGASIADLHRKRLAAIARGGLGSADPRADEALAAAPDTALLLARVALQRGAFAEARDRAEAHAGRAESDVERVEAERLLGTALYNLGDLTGALARLDRAVTHAASLGDPVQHARALDDRGFVHGYAARFADALADHEAALALLGDQGPLDAVATTRNNLGFACWMLGRYDEALAHLDAALAARQRLRDAWGEGVTRNNLGNVLRHRGDLRGAMAAYERAIALCHRAGNALYEAIAWNNLGQCDEEQDAFERARGRYERALALARRLGDRIREGDNLGNLGICLLRMGRTDEARDWLERAVAHRRDIGDRAYLVLDLSFLAVAAEALGDRAAAVACIDEALSNVDEGVEQVQAVYLNAAKVLRAAGRGAEASAALERGLRIVRERAAALPEEAREAFVSGVRVNRELAALSG